MKKFLIILTIILSVFISPVIAAEDEPSEELNPEGWWKALWDGVYPTYDLYVRSVLMGNSLNFGGGFSIGAETPAFRFEYYLQGDYFMSPLGTSGTAAALEMDFETGLSLGWKFLKFWSFDVYVACDIGYYMQLVQTHYQPNRMTIGFNGIMLRPKLMTELNIGKWYGISVGVFYQFPLYPYYDRYQGVGIMMSIL